MEWDNREAQENQNQQRGENNNVNGVMYVKVMTDEQLETLRKQISVYATICEQLVEMHKSLSAQQDLTGGRLGNIYCDPLMTSAGHKITARQRWTPTPVQLQILESIFDQGNGTPSKQKIKEITAELSQHGQISETNVYNWFQNRRARSKRKQLVSSSANAESEVETEVDSLHEKKTKPEINCSSQQNPAASRPHDDMCFHSPEISSELHFLGVFSNPRDDHLTGKVGMPGAIIFMSMQKITTWLVDTFSVLLSLMSLSIQLPNHGNIPCLLLQSLMIPNELGFIS